MLKGTYCSPAKQTPPSEAIMGAWLQALYPVLHLTAAAKHPGRRAPLVYKVAKSCGLYWRSSSTSPRLQQ